MLTFAGMGEKKYDTALQKRVSDLRKDLGPQPLATLWAMDAGLRKVAAKCRRILSGKTFPGDLDDVQRMEKAKAKLMRVRY